MLFACPPSRSLKASLQTWELVMTRGADDPPFFVAYVHGPGGIGKSRLIHAALDRISPQVNRYVMDCRQIERTPQGFQIALGAALELREPEPDFATVVNRLTEQKQRSVLALDTYLHF